MIKLKIDGLDVHIETARTGLDIETESLLAIQALYDALKDRDELLGEVFKLAVKHEIELGILFRDDTEHVYKETNDD